MSSSGRDPGTPVSASVTTKQAGKRFDQVLAEMFPDYSRARLQAWIRSGHARLDGHQVLPRLRVKAGQRAELAPQATPVVAAQAEALPLNIVFEDADLLVVSKPAGLVVHPGAGNPTGTLLNGLLHHAPELEQLPRAGILHRLDKDTSGLLLVARSLAAHTRLTRDLEQREIRREYRAVCNDQLTAGGRVDAPVGRHRTQRTRMAVTSAGRPAVTHYRVLQRFVAHTLIAVRLETGRTHQIRVHMQHAGHPLVGDPVYGGRLRLPKGADDATVAALQGFRRQALHACALGFRHPRSGAALEFQAPLPADMVTLLSALAGSAAGDFDALHWP